MSKKYSHINNYFYDLPAELQEKILVIRNNNSAKKIQKIWNSYHAKFNALIKLSYKCYYELEPGEHGTTIYILAASEETTANIIEFIDKKIKPTDRILFITSDIYINLFKEIYDALKLEEYIAKQGSNIKYYNRTYNAFYNILNTLNMKWLFDYEDEYLT